MQVLFYDNLTLNVSGIPMDQNKQQQSKFIHFLEPDFITSNTSLDNVDIDHSIYTRFY